MIREEKTTENQCGENFNIEEENNKSMYREILKNEN